MTPVLIIETSLLLTAEVIPIPPLMVRVSLISERALLPVLPEIFKVVLIVAFEADAIRPLESTVITGIFVVPP